MTDEEGVRCLDRDSAREEAERRQATETDPGFYWNAVCLDGEWFAKRYEWPKPKGGLRGFLHDPTWTPPPSPGG